MTKKKKPEKKAKAPRPTDWRKAIEKALEQKRKANESPKEAE